jgi:uncharacterized membrane protein (DUF2068 family)
MADSRAKGDQLVIAYKFGKAALEFLGAGFVLLAARHPGAYGLAALGAAIHEHLSAKWAHVLEGLLTKGTTSHVSMLALALALDAVSCLVEGWAVWRRRPWAPWLIVVATGGLIPIEIVLIMEKASFMRVLILVINVATVAYMVHTRWQRRLWPAHPHLRRLYWAAPGALLISYLALAYLVLPWVLRQRDLARTVDADAERAIDSAGQPRDPLNVALVGSEEDVLTAMARAGWVLAERLSRRSAFDIADDVLLHRPLPDAPVSSLFVAGRRQDLAFEQEVGSSPRRRHHVRFWRRTEDGVDGRPFWIGAASFDRGVGLARGTGQVTHAVDPNVDKERDKLIDDLVDCGCVNSVHRVPGPGKISPRKGGYFFTDGYTAVAVLSEAPPAATLWPPSNRGLTAR